MNAHRLVKAGFIAMALVLGAGAYRSATLEASGYMMSCGRTGEVVCEPGGSQDCGGVTEVL